MNVQKIRMVLAVVVLSLALFGNSIVPAAAQGPIVGDPIVVQYSCTKGTVSYPLGAVVRYTLQPPPDPVYVWARCELRMPSTPGAGLTAVWIYYRYNPG